MTDLPFSQEAEEAIIGAILQASNEAYYVASQSVSSDDFYITRLRWIYEACQRLAQRNVQIDYLVLAEALTATGQIEEIGGRPFLTYLMNTTPSAYHVRFYADIVQHASKRRQLMRVADEMKALALDESIDFEQALSESSSKLSQVKNPNAKGLRAIADDIGEHMETRLTPVDNSVIIPSALSALDKLIRGYRPKKVYTIAGRPGEGKSSFIHTELVNACRKKKRVALFTMENNIEDVEDELASQMTYIPFEAIQDGKMDDKQKRLYVSAIGEIGKHWNLFIDDTPRQTVENISNELKRLMLTHGVDIAFIDYVQLIQVSNSKRYSNRTAELTHIMQEIKIMAKEISIPVVIGSQIPRSADGRRPTLSDLSDSSEIEKSSDVVMMLHSEDQSENNPIRLTEILVRKARNGKRGFVEVGFKGEFKKFISMARAES